MTAATLDSGAPLGNTMGSMLLGVIFSAILYGISLLQCLFYFTRYKRDPIYLKVIPARSLETHDLERLPRGSTDGINGRTRSNVLRVSNLADLAEVTTGIHDCTLW
ncbi:hypothetical protein R3P38DRAFT_3245028 [Favolaschia claudopus]|uniref:ATP synthase F0 subunit 8 n=1 Tax=Favolaschia claudopus TaxID=2862362 RepID=A0AAV9Z1E4_9AGAR